MCRVVCAGIETVIWQFVCAVSGVLGSMCRVVCAGIEVVICMVVCMELQHDCCIFCSFRVKSSV
ncbi:hypothetical protein Patl1_20328 [Pistacia atlantica]|uniref:Uncharacterized protein n=1 Tax=Pistacia atlantica TaxID=434234 RepID=A0ACC1BI53_9ROSI|nr:hypothetical protein Patl1_20328 [Pistacia atlantica]